jgi:hypothetical protein
MARLEAVGTRHCGLVEFAESMAVFSGGCLCGTVRYTAKQAPTAAHYCHCSICRRQSGSVVGAFVTVASAALEAN